MSVTIKNTPRAGVKNVQCKVLRNEQYLKGCVIKPTNVLHMCSTFSLSLTQLWKLDKRRML